MNQRARRRTNTETKIMPAPKQTQPWNPSMKRRHLDRIIEMAEQSGREPQEVYQELLDAATSNEAPPSPAPRAAPATANTGAPRSDGRTVAKVVVHPQPGNTLLGESMAQAKARESGEDQDENAASDEETDDAPPEKMQGGRPNPLRTPSLKEWAGRKDDAEDDDPAAPEPKQDDRKEALRRKYMPHARVQNRG